MAEVKTKKYRYLPPSHVWVGSHQQNFTSIELISRFAAFLSIHYLSWGRYLECASMLLFWNPFWGRFLAEFLAFTNPTLPPTSLFSPQLKVTSLLDDIMATAFLLVEGLASTHLALLLARFYALRQATGKVPVLAFLLIESYCFQNNNTRHATYVT